MQMTQSYAVELDIEPAQNMSMSMGSSFGAGNSQPQNDTPSQIDWRSVTNRSFSSVWARL
jgi:hypothetical protein